MHPKNKPRPAASGAAGSQLKPLVLHDVTNRPGSLAAQARLPVSLPRAGGLRPRVSRQGRS